MDLETRDKEVRFVRKEDYDIHTSKVKIHEIMIEDLDDLSDYIEMILLNLQSWREMGIFEDMEEWWGV
ncbi:hypothetical protein L1999_09360 [Neobacillus drentensis]|uniref:hypothetical protein n=1 Tax=Neobacillus drentensis TaxID=220684 RepID=UPI001F293566|nr:hypothetical protein [Neobacillus drentensis]ULT58712.1 hypothetical protein L1999_09360 [Neobacillus drentensis]